MAEPERRSRRRKRRRPQKKKVAAGGLLVLALLGFAFLRVKQPAVYELDTNAATMEDGGTQSIEKLQAQLQSQADASSFRLQINGRPRVTGDQAELLLGNPVENKLSLSVSIILNEDGETLYKSGSLVPGAQVLTAALKRTLPPGEYAATAVCTASDPETGGAVGSPVMIDLLLNVVEAAAPP